MHTPLPSRATPRTLLLLAISLPGLGGLTSCGPTQSEAKADAPPPPKVTVTLPIERETIDWDVFTGRLVSPRTVAVRARVSGYLEEVHFTEGSEVKEGDLLFTIDPRPYEAIVQRMEAGVANAKSRVDLTTQELENVARLQSSGSISAEDYQRRANAAAGATASFQAAEAELREAKLNLEFTQIRSPIDGRVSDARITKGNVVTDGVDDESLLTTVVALDPIYCHLDVDERSVLKYRQLHREGKRISAQFGKVEAEMELTLETGFPHKGVIDFVDNELDPATGTIRARAVFPNPDRLMAPGFFARVRVPGSGKYPGLLVPDRAIADDQGTSFVWVVGEDDTVVYRKVSTGPLLDGLRIVREGLASGERVVVDGVMAVRQGQKVTPEMIAAATAETAPAASAETPAPAPAETPAPEKPESPAPAN